MPEITVARLSEDVKEFVESRQWTKYHKPKDIAIALSIEASELLEIFQWSGGKTEITEDELLRIKHETADIAIYALSMANACGFDLGDAVVDKMELNASKYPKEKSRDLFG